MSHLDEGTLHALLDGEIATDSVEPVKQHLATCSDCQQRLDEARQFRTEALGLVEILEVPQLVTAALRPQLRSSIPTARAPNRWSMPAAWAATLVLATGVGYLLRGPMGATPEEPVARDLAVNPGRPPAPVPSEVGEVVANPSLTRQQKAKLPREDDGMPKGRVPAVTSPPPGPPKTNTSVDQPSSPVVDSESKKVEASPAAANSVAFDEVAATSERRRQEQQAPRAAGRSLAATRASDTESGRGGAAAEKLDKAVLRLDRPALPNPADQRTRVVSAVVAISALGGSIRLVDGLTPTRFEQTGEVIRVIYRTGFGILALEQWRAGELLAHELISPATAPSDSVLAWEGRIR